jgi:hypothetical protein
MALQQVSRPVFDADSGLLETAELSGENKRV